MPVRINLKELFGSDSQNVTIDKLNFNFNKLLELGIGLEGARGITGGTGSIGPSGIKGDQGDKGNQWFVGTSDPNATTFPGLMDEDFYVLSDNSQIWQYDELTDTWTVIVDLGGIVNNYLNTAGTTFVRGFGEGSPQDSRYIVFPNRGNSVTDQQGDKIGTGVSNNDILLLSNFNETLQGLVLDIDDDLSDTDKYYSAIQKIYVDRSNPVDKRYHLELGSLNDVGSTGTPFNLSTLNQNLKLRHEYKNGIFNGVFSLTKLESDLPSTITHNGIFDFQFAKFNAAPLVQKEGFVQMGSRYAHLAMGRSYVEFDGINFNVSGVGNAGIGIGENFDNDLTHINGGNYLVIKSDDTGVSGIMLDSKVYQDNGNIEQLATGPATVHSAIGSGVGNVPFNTFTYGLGGIAISGNRIIQASASTTTADPGTDLSDAAFEGYFHVSDLGNPNSPMAIASYAATGQSAAGSTILPVGAVVSDIEVNGEYVYVINNQQFGVHNTDTIGSNAYTRTNLQVIKYDTDSGDDFTSISQRNNVYLDGAHRIKINGHRAIIINNRLRGWGDLAGNASDSQFNEEGYVTAIDITDESVSTYLDTIAVTENDRTHHLDLEVANNKAYTISITMNAPVGVNHPGFGVSVRSYNLDEVVGGTSPVGTSLGTESSYNIVPPNTTNVNATNYDNLTVINKFGAIAVSGDVVWAIHKNILYTLKQDATTGSFTPLNILAYDADVDMRAMDIKVVGDSIYILGASGNPTSAYAPTNTHLIKVNNTNVSSPSIVSKTDINEASSSRLLVEGNNIYINKANGSTGYLIPLEVDGFKTDAIKAGSIKTSYANITDDLRVGDRLNVGQSLNVGSGGIKSIGPIAAKNIIATKLGVNKDTTVLAENIHAAQISGNLLLHNTHVAGDTQIHFNADVTNGLDSEIVNLSPNGDLIIKTTPNYTTTNDPSGSNLMRIIGGANNGIYMYTPDSTGLSQIGDIKIRPGDYTIAGSLPLPGSPPYYNEGVIVLERRVQMINSIEDTENIPVGGNFDNTPFGAGGLFLRRSALAGNWATDTFSVSVVQSSKQYDRILRVSSGGSPSGTPPARLVVWIENGPGDGLSSVEGSAGNWHIAKRVPFDNYIVEQVIIPSCHRFYVELDGSMGSTYTTSLNLRQYRFGKLDEGCSGKGNFPTR